jgi:glycosyltransferase involved in cell wall biosynthesis
MKILLAHTYYRIRGGEDVVFESERDLLRSYGHWVVTFIRHNESLAARSSLANTFDTIWSPSVYRDLLTLLRREKPDIVHFHNTFPAISPSAYYACRDAGIPVVQTLHNYRLVCPGALLVRNGLLCEDCLRKKIPWPGVLHGCWQGSALRTGAVATMLSVHRFLHTWDELVDRYIVLSNFLRQKLMSGGLPVHKFVVKPNFVFPDPGPGEHEGGYALFAGRLSQEKGVWTLLNAWRSLPNIPLKIAGDGPLRHELEQFAKQNGLSKVSFIGKVPRQQVFELMQQAKVLVVPSEVPETFGMMVVEAFACGLPVVATPEGALSEIIREGHTGFFFRTVDANMLAGKIRWAWNHPAVLEQIGFNARDEYEQKYTAERNYQSLMTIYKSLSKNI